MTDLICSYIKTAVQEHAHTKSDITDLIISNNIFSSSTSTLTQGTNYFTITLEQTSIDWIDVYLFKFINTDEFSADLFYSFNLLITDNNSNTIIQATMGYSNNQYSVNSTSSGVMAGVITSNGFYYGKLMENLTIVQFIISLSDSDENVLRKYTIDPVYVDSSHLLTFGVIDEIYVRKTDNDNDISDIKNDIDGKADKEHTLTKSEINDLTISDTIYDINSSILVSLTESIEYFNVEVSNTAIQFTTTSNFDASIFSSFTVSSNNFTNTYTRRNINTRTSASPKYTSITSKTYFQIADLPTVADTYIITDSSGIVLCKYTVNYSSEVNSSYLLTFGAINETYTRKTELDSFKTELIDLFYPVGSIYTCMNSTSPADIFGGTWAQITDRFLYCANSSGSTGGSSSLTEANLPEHTHTFTDAEATDDLQFRRSTNSTNLGTFSSNSIFNISQKSADSWQCKTDLSTNPTNADFLTWTYTPEGTISSTGSGAEFLPPYITVYAWYRTG